MRLTFRSIGHISPTVSWGMKSHKHDGFHELIVILRGKLQATIRNQQIVASPGEVLLYPLGEAHAEQALGKEPVETLHVAWWSAPTTVRNWPLKGADPHGRLEYLIRWMWDVHHLPPSPQRDVQMKTLLAALLCAYESLAHPAEDELVSRVRKYVQSHLSQSLQLDDLAAEVGLSRYHFLRRFRQRAGETPMQFLRRLRVNAAKTLLQTTPFTLRAIAQHVGFADEYHLSRVFYETTGQRPSHMRKRTKKK
jgi:AraC family transcriptional regulator of arabinose operon